MTIAWRDDAPRMTAADVDAAEFPLTPWGRRGYDQAAVDAFLGRVRDELQACAVEAAGLREEVARLRRRFVASQRGGEWLADAGEAHAMAVAIMSEGQQAAERYVADAQAYAGRLAQDASERRAEILAEAEQVLAGAREQARDAALAALDEPLPGQEGTGRALQAARAEAAYTDVFSRATLTHIRAVLAAELEVIDEAIGRALRDQDAPEPGIHPTWKERA